MSIYDLNPELDSPQYYGDPATDPVGTVRAYLGAHPRQGDPVLRVYVKIDADRWQTNGMEVTRNDNWVKDCPVIYRPSVSEGGGGRQSDPRPTTRED